MSRGQCELLERRQNVFYLLKTGWMADFPGKLTDGHRDAS